MGEEGRERGGVGEGEEVQVSLPGACCEVCDGGVGEGEGVMKGEC